MKPPDEEGNVFTRQEVLHLIQELRDRQEEAGKAAYWQVATGEEEALIQEGQGHMQAWRVLGEMAEKVRWY